ncbi:hypothetical protein BVH03_04365 [Pseudomonas sp. PA15(2017)]|nr:hypothetical protein BVH03_04365 [Pseudomonas sp. PA15(2017)]
MAGMETPNFRVSLRHLHGSWQWEIVSIIKKPLTVPADTRHILKRQVEQTIRLSAANFRRANSIDIMIIFSAGISQRAAAIDNHLWNAFAFTRSNDYS